MKNLLNTVKAPLVKKSFFDMSFEHKTTLNMGWCIPIAAEPVVPSDKWTGSVSSLIKFAPMLAPMMHQVNVYTHTFFVPYRLLWRGNTQNNRWNDYIANIKTAGALPVPPVVQIDITRAQSGELSNYLMIPKPTPGDIVSVLAFNHAAYQCIWNEYYRDENLQDEADYLLTDGDNSGNTDLFKLRQRCWEKDYLTGCLPFAQKGDPVNIPMTNFDDVQVQVQNASVPFNSWDTDQAPPDNKVFAGTGASSNPDINDNWLFAQTSQLNAGSAITVNELRTLYTLQRWYEQLARGGTRPNEFIKVIFGIDSPDKRLQRPEYITGSKSPVMVSEVLQTSETNATPQGTMAGHGSAITRGNNSSYFVQEYGVIMTILSVMPKTGYFQGMPRQYIKYDDPTQHYIPTFDHLGEQDVYNIEVKVDSGLPSLDTFGYIPRYAEYKVPQNRCTGEFQSTLLFWHMNRDLTGAPQLNADFVACDATDRIFAVTGNIPHLYVSCWVEQKMVRPMSKYSTPSW